MSKPARWALELCAVAVFVYFTVCVLMSSRVQSTDEQQIQVNADAAASKLSEPVR